MTATSIVNKAPASHIIVNNVSVNKPAIATAFGRSAQRYDEVAQLQRNVGERLCQQVPAPDRPSTDRRQQLLDAGCGTGYFSRYWQQRGNEVFALDLAAPMLAVAQQQQSADHYLQGDIEHIPLPAASIDLCFSNLAIQWCQSLSGALQEFYRVTRPGGMILFSTLRSGSLDELAQAWQQIDGLRHVNEFLPLSTIEQACQPYRHQLIAQTHTLQFPTLLALLQSLKGIGATHLHHGRAAGLGGRRQLQALATAYPQQQGRFPLSYHVVYGVIYRE